MRVTRNASQDCLCPKYLDLLAENARLKEDIARLKAKGAVCVTLGHRILRTETAGPAVLAMLLYELEDGR